MNRSKRITASLAACAILVGGFGTAGVAFGDQKSDLKAKQQQQEKELEEMKSSLEGVDTDLQSIYLELEQTKTQIPIAEAELTQARTELTEAERNQESVAAQLDAAQAELDQITSKLDESKTKMEETRNNLGEIARSQYRGDVLPSTIDLIMGSSSTDDFLNQHAASSALTRTQTATLTEVEQSTAKNMTRQARQQDIEDQIKDLHDQATALVAEKAEKEDAASKKSDDLNSLKSSYESQSANMEARKADFEHSINGLEDDIDSTQAAIAEIDRANATGSGPKPPANVGSSWLIPVVPAPLYVTSAFGMRNYPFGGFWMHNGVDLRSPCGEAQVSPGNGVIAKVIPAPGNSTHGNQVYINLGNVDGASWVAVTNHLSKFNVKVGQTVSKGDVIGWTGQTGKVTGCHVHMEVWKNGKVVDPMSFPSFTRRN